MTLFGIILSSPDIPSSLSFLEMRKKPSSRALTAAVHFPQEFSVFSLFLCPKVFPHLDGEVEVLLLVAIEVFVVYFY